MRREKFEEAVQDLKIGDRVRITLKGKWGNYTIDRILEGIEKGYLHYTMGMSSSFRRIKAIRKIDEA